MEECFRGKVTLIEKDKDFNNKLVGKIDTDPEMHFFVRDMEVKVGDSIEIIKEDNEIGYKSVKVV
jgi:hypothetical protein